MRRLGLQWRVNSMYQGVAAGVGQARMSGRVENVPIKIGEVEFPMHFMVLEVQEDLLMLGLDQMRKYKCHIDLEKNCIIFGGIGGIEVGFLSNPTMPRMMPQQGCAQQ